MNEKIKLIPIAAKKIYQGKRFYCPVCDTRLWWFNPVPKWYIKKLDYYGYIHSIFALETFNLFAHSCPNCKLSDTKRLYALYIREAFKKLDQKSDYTFLHFAPSSLSQKIRSYPFIKYLSVDLAADSVDLKADLIDLPYRADSIDMFLCSHVMEHIEDDRKAMTELFRILKPGGWGIVMAPIQLTLSDVYEDNSIKGEADRWKYFGQGDHVRLYSKQGFVARLTDAGFKVNQLGLDYFGADVFEKHGIHPRSVLYVVEKGV